MYRFQATSRKKSLLIKGDEQQQGRGSPMVEVVIVILTPLRYQPGHRPHPTSVSRKGVRVQLSGHAQGVLRQQSGPSLLPSTKTTSGSRDMLLVIAREHRH